MCCVWCDAYIDTSCVVGLSKYLHCCLYCDFWYTLQVLIFLWCTAVFIHWQLLQSPSPISFPASFQMCIVSTAVEVYSLQQLKLSRDSSFTSGTSRSQLLRHVLSVKASFHFISFHLFTLKAVQALQRGVAIEKEKMAKDAAHGHR